MILPSFIFSSLIFFESGYQDAIISAGIAKIGVCENKRKYARKVKDGTISLIQKLADEGIKPIYISSDYVFDGRMGHYDDDAPTHPLNEYGKQKAEIEMRIKEICKGNYLIARLSKAFTLEQGDGTLFDEMASVLTSGGTIRAASDQVFSPTLLSDTVQAVKALQAKGATGTFNICSPEVWSRYDLALKMADCLGINSNQVERICLDDLNEPFKRPKDTTMATEKLRKKTNCAFTPIEQCIKQVAEHWKVHK